MNEEPWDTGGHDALERRISALTPTQRRLFDRILAQENAGQEGIPRRPQGETEIAVSYEQERLWFMNALVTYRQIFHVPVALRLRGPLRPQALEQALDGLVDRHEALRTVFREGRTGLCQVVLDRLRVPLSVEDCRGADDPLGEARRRASASVTEPFDLGSGPLLRCRLYEVGEQDHVLALVQHHIISDYWSLGILLEDLGALYAAVIGAGPDLEPLDLHYPDFAHWQRRETNGDAVQRGLAHWRDQLSDVSDLLELPTDRPRPPVRGSQGTFQHIEFPADAVRRLRAIAKEESTTLLGVFLALYAGFLGRLVREDSLVVGVPVAARGRPETQRMVGYFLNWLPIRIDLGGRPSLRELVRRAGRALSDAMTHQDLPFDVLVQELAHTRRPGTTPIFQTSLSLRDSAPEPPQMPGMDISFFDLEGGATHFDLMAELWCEDDRVLGYLPFDDELFDESTVERYAEWLVRLACETSREPDRPFKAAPLMSMDDETRSVGAGPAEVVRVQGTLYDRFAEQARLRPESIAVTHEDRHLTYGELHERVGHVARTLREYGVGPGSFVGVVLDRSPELVAGILGILASGAAYMPVDPGNPQARTAEQFAGYSVKVVLTDEGARGRLPEGGYTVLKLAEKFFEKGLTTPEKSHVSVPSSAPAYVIHTSGSTGDPKGVLVSHANVLRLLAVSERFFEPGPEDVWTLFHSASFDFSVWELWGCLAHGGRLVSVPQWMTRAPDMFLELVRSEKVTILNQTPSAFSQFASVALAEPRSLALRYVVFGGEALDYSALGVWFDAFGDEHPRLVNMYGITETTVHVTFRQVTTADTRLSRSLIGEPLPDLSLYILDDEMRPVPDGVPGEIHVGGAGVALGYLNSPRLTAQRMLPDPFTRIPGARMYRTGDIAIRRTREGIAYLGRADEQCKIRGHRVEVGGLRAALNRLDGVMEGAVTVEEDASGNKILVAYVVGSPMAEITSTRVRRALLADLPEWMVPSIVVMVDELPLTRNGKLDSRALAALRRRRTRDTPTESRPPSTKTQRVLAKIWSDVLGREGVGADSNFFELGGHSLMVVRLVSSIAHRLDVRIPMETLFQNPMLQEMAEEVDRLRRAPIEEASPGSEIESVEGPSVVTETEAVDIATMRAKAADRMASVPAPAAPLPIGDDQVVLLTGASGFLGGFTLAELLARGTRVICLLRGGVSRENELRRRLEALGVSWNQIRSRLEIVEGDVGEPRLGLSSPDHESLVERVGRLVHVAAWVNHIYPYEELARINAYSVPALVAFASTGRRKSVTFVSTSAVLESPSYGGDVEIANGPLHALPSARNGYARSKAVAELHLAYSAQADVPCTIVRCPSVYGDRRRYQVSETDYIWSWTKAMVATGHYPSEFDTPGNRLFQALPADAVATLLADLGRSADPAGCRYINAIPNTVGHTQDLLAGLREAGHHLESMPDRQWYARVGRLDTREVWVAGIAGHLAELSDASVVRQRLRRFRTDEEPDVSRFINENAVSAPADIAHYVRTLLDQGTPSS
ncbi:non-ribosomal peptide synthetase [Nocardiopsis alkaliphila]|uniref:non-ribosomal peptide synthetase n=1 Tax=Nocardiopsis alkaliphila TaxID=225762 RepID=UPI00034AEBE3|nr:non-ribosomal peptide synthetase [Nocardiopsis alkaliphila]